MDQRSVANDSGLRHRLRSAGCCCEVTEEISRLQFIAGRWRFCYILRHRSRGLPLLSIVLSAGRFRDSRRADRIYGCTFRSVRPARAGRYCPPRRVYRSLPDEQRRWQLHGIVFLHRHPELRYVRAVTLQKVGRATHDFVLLDLPHYVRISDEYGRDRPQHGVAVTSFRLAFLRDLPLASALHPA